MTQKPDTPSGESLSPLTLNPAHRDVLDRKRKEYHGRLENPDRTGISQKRLQFRIAIIDALLQGSADPTVLRAVLCTDGNDHVLLEGQWRVISDYNATGGKNLEKSPPVNPPIVPPASQGAGEEAQGHVG